MTNIDDSTLYEIITGRVEPHIYSFETNTLPNMLKVGDTYRPVEERLNEWRRYYENLSEVSRHRAVIGDNIFFRDHSVHKYLESNGVKRAQIDQTKGIYSQEFFHDIGKLDVTAAVEDVVDSYDMPGKYSYYDHLKDKIEQRYARDRSFSPRDNQQQVIDNFINAVEKNRTNLLMYAVMRFGKSVTSMWCAKEIDSKLTIVVSAKADVRSEWKQTVESHIDFKGYRFIDGADITTDTDLSDIYGQPFLTGGGNNEICTNIVMFFTLQDLAGSTDEIKARHRILEDTRPDLLIIDETHFAARAQVLGKILTGVKLNEEDEESLKDTSGIDELGKIQGLKAINAKVKLHLSGTPYRILMGSEFEQEDIIAFVQFSDIYESKIHWQKTHLDQEEWRNPYYGFPQMIRFAFNPNESSRAKLESIPGSKPAEIFAPVDTSKRGNYEKFKHEVEAIDLLQALDGSKQDTQLLGLLDHASIKSGKLARHVVVVLPYRASCDAFEKLINEHADLFKNMSEYTLLNISGHNNSLTKPQDIKNTITKAEEAGKKTMTLTVNKMLTGTTVPQWDTMVYLKATTSPQEYDQAIFRLQSPWLKTYADDSDEVIKYDMKPQTLLVDLDPTRLFHLQEVKAFTYGANTHEIGNENIEKFIKRELKVSPVLAINAENNKLIEIEASKIIDAVRKYSSERTISDDVNEISVDISLRDNEDIYNVVNKLSELSGKNGLNIPTAEGDNGQDLDGAPETPADEDDEEGAEESPDSSGADDQQDDGIKTFEKQFRMYYVLILLFAFLSNTTEKSLADVISNIDANDDNRRIARSLGLKKNNLETLRSNINWTVLSSLDYKIQNSDFRSSDETITPVEHVETAINKFGKLSDSEVFTPSPTVSRIYDAFDADFWLNAKSAKILDIASKSGNFARGFVDKALEYGLTVEDIKDNIYSIPTSPAAYEFTRKMYEAIGLNLDNIAQHFDSYELLNLTDPRSIMMTNKKFCDITEHDLAESDKIDMNESEDEVIKFTAVVGNPPYQGDNHKQIYPNFYLSARELGEYVSLIFPIGWQEPKNGNNLRLLNTKEIKHDKQIVSIDNNQNIFPGIPGAEWTNIILWHKGHDNELDGKQQISINGNDPKPTLLSTERNTYSKPPQIIQLARIVNDKPGFLSMQTITSSRKPYGLTTDVIKKTKEYNLPTISSRQSKDDDIRLYGLKGKVYFLDAGYPLPKNNPNLHEYKVFVPYAWGNWAEKTGLGGAYSDIIVAHPNEAVTETYLEQGPFSNVTAANYHAKYILTKFTRALLYLNKHSQHSTTSWGAVPVQDYSEDWWSKSIEEIDVRLMQKYEIPVEIQKFVFDNIQTKSASNIINFFEQ